MIHLSQVTGLLLSGGQGRRVGNQDKGCLPFNGTTLAESQLDWLKQQTANCLISANRNLSFYSQLGYSVVIDPQNNFPGPLTGILKALEQCETDWLFVVPVDVPYLPSNLLESLLSELNRLLLQSKNHYLGFYLETDERSHFLNLLLSKKALPILLDFVAKDKKRVKDFLVEINAQPLNLGIEESAFRNMNELADFNLKS